MRSFSLFLLLINLFFISCGEDKPIDVQPLVLHNSIDKVTDIMVHDIFSPPVASRVFAYPNIAAYEIVAQANPQYKSLAGQLKGLKPIPKPEKKGINYRLAAMITHLELSRGLIFSEDMMVTYQDSLYKSWRKLNKNEFEVSKEYADKVVNHFHEWMDKDKYKETRTMSKFTVISNDPSRWQPTPPAYMDGIEPHWMEIRPFCIEAADQFKPAPPPAFSMEDGTEFHKQLMEVYNTKLEIEKEGDENEKLAIAKFWDCNPYVSVTRGHLMFAKKKISPGAHWIGITKIACKRTNSDFDKSVYAYTEASIAMADAFISCWDEKYRSNLIRPETLINKYIDENWTPVLQTPPFPEYTSGHSVVSGAAAIVLTRIFGDNFSFDDDTEMAYGLPIRSYNSFNQASAEAAISRMYGGIHYRAAIEVGLKQGRRLGNYVVSRLEMEKPENPVVSNL
ncbi:MAG: vanadium-dependent haloperoxidase [Salegentibacter sp.]